MENDILLAIKCIKEISKKKRTLTKIEAYAKKNNTEVSKEELSSILESMIGKGLIEKQGERQNLSYIIPEQCGSNITDTQEDTSARNPQQETGETVIAVNDTISNTESGAMGLVMKDISSLKNFQKTVEKKRFDLDRALILQQTIPNSSNICNNETGNENAKSDFIFNLLKNRIANLEDEISKKDAIIDHLTNKLFNVSHNNKKNLQKDDDNNGKNSKSTHEKTSSHGNGERNDKKKVVVTGESLLNGINERGLSKPYKVNIQNFPGGTSETILEELDTLVASKPDCIIIHAGTNDFTNGINSLNSVKKNC